MQGGLNMQRMMFYHGLPRRAVRKTKVCSCKVLCSTGAHSITCLLHPAPQVSGMARQMVINYGMSELGPWSLMDPSAQSGDVIMCVQGAGTACLEEQCSGAVLTSFRENRVVLGFN